MSRSLCGLALLLRAWIVAESALAADPPKSGSPAPTSPPSRVALDLIPTQVTIAIEEGGLARPFRATVLGVCEDTLTLLTAARLVDGVVEGRPARFLLDDEAIPGVVLSVARNPLYNPAAAGGTLPGRLRYLGRSGVPSGVRRQPVLPYHHRHPIHRPDSYSQRHDESPGADNAIARLWFPQRPTPGQRPVDRAFRSIRPAAPLLGRTSLAAGGDAWDTLIIDARGKEHVFRSGNFENPRFLQWGHAFHPNLDDAGSGVFALREGPGGRPEPVLIGVLLGRDAGGGHASLVSRNMLYVDHALREADLEPEPGGEGRTRLNPALPDR